LISSKEDIQLSSKEDIQRFQALFRKYIASFALPVVRLARGEKKGKVVLKTATSPAFKCLSGYVKGQENALGLDMFKLK
jgi:hypothetical protein